MTPIHQLEIVPARLEKTRAHLVLHRDTVRNIFNNNNDNNDKICSAHISTLLGAQGANPETPGQAPSLSR